MIIKDFRSFSGQHCETTATGSLLKNIGIELSEPMLFGIGQGLGFIYWHMKNMDFPFLGGRVKQDALTQNIVSNLGLNADYRETSSKDIAWKNVKTNIDSGIPVGLKLDCYHLDYFSSKIHFAGHYVAIYGYDEKYAYLVDTAQQGSTVQTSLESLASARGEKGPMASKNLSYTISKGSDYFDLDKVIPKAIKSNAADFINPPIKNIGYSGIHKAGTEIKKWLGISKDIERDFEQTANLMERGGTGGALFRNLYRDFLKESYDLLGKEILNEAYAMYSEIALLWTTVSGLIEKTAETRDANYINQASEILYALSQKEHSAMELLSRI